MTQALTISVRRQSAAAIAAAAAEFGVSVAVLQKHVKRALEGRPDRHIIARRVEGDRERCLHATKGWRTRRMPG